MLGAGFGLLQGSWDGFCLGRVNAVGAGEGSSQGVCPCHSCVEGLIPRCWDMSHVCERIHSELCLCLKKQGCVFWGQCPLQFGMNHTPVSAFFNQCMQGSDWGHMSCSVTCGHWIPLQTLRRKCSWWEQVVPQRPLAASRSFHEKIFHSET